MKKLVLAVGSGAVMWLGAAGTVLAVDTPIVPIPSQCADMTFDHTITATNAKIVTGTEGRDLIVVGNANKVDGKGGGDCIVVGTSNSVTGGAGNDVIIVNGKGNKVLGGDGADKIYDLAGGNLLQGQGGDDTLVGKGNTSVDGGSGTDTCTYDKAKGIAKNCEPLVVTTATKLLRTLGL